MTAPCRPVEEDDLHARIDGRLPRERIADVDTYLAADPEVEVPSSEYAAQRQLLRAAFAAQAGGPIPARLRVANVFESDSAVDPVSWRRLPPR